MDNVPIEEAVYVLTILRRKSHDAPKGTAYISFSVFLLGRFDGKEVVEEIRKTEFWGDNNFGGRKKQCEFVEYSNKK